MNDLETLYQAQLSVDPEETPFDTDLAEIIVTSCAHEPGIDETDYSQDFIIEMRKSNKGVIIFNVNEQTVQNDYPGSDFPQITESGFNETFSIIEENGGEIDPDTPNADKIIEGFNVKISCDNEEPIYPVYVVSQDLGNVKEIKFSTRVADEYPAYQAAVVVDDPNYIYLHIEKQPA